MNRMFSWTELQPNETIGDANYDFLPQRYQEFVAEHQLPPIEKYPTRDGALLAVRIYKCKDNQEEDDDNNKKRINIILLHGATVDSTFYHPFAHGLLQKEDQQRGIIISTIYVPDVRGHGDSIVRTKGSLDYKWQNLDDLEDMMKHYNLDDPQTTVFVGHSASGGTAWYLASHQIWQNRFRAFVAITPMMGLQLELIKEPATSNFARPNTPRLIALTILNAIGITRLNRTSVLRFFAQPATSIEEFTYEYDFNMTISHSPMVPLNYKTVLSKIPKDKRILSISAGNDETFTDYTPILKPLFPSGQHVTIEDTIHMGILFDEKLMNTVSDFVTTDPV